MKKFTVSNMSPTVFNWISYDGTSIRTKSLFNRREILLTETVPKEDTDRLIKGDRSFVPLLVMYDDIAEKYPDKVKQNKANQTFDYGGLDDDV